MLSKKSLKDKSPEDIRKMLDEAYMNIMVDEKKLVNPLEWPKECADEPHKWIVYVMSRPEYFWFFAKEIMNLDLYPFQCIILKELWNKRFPMLIGSRGMSKTFLLATYNLFRMTLLPKRKLVLAGAAFRQAKAVFNYMDTIWSNAPLLRDIAYSYSNKDAGPSHEPDMWKFKIGQSVSMAIPVGPGGDKIRGLRANDLIVDEKNSIPKEVFETVMVPFTAVSSNPIGNAKRMASEKMLSQIQSYLEDLGIALEDVSDDVEDYILPNQLIMSGTAGYTFEQYFQDWRDAHDIICSGGDKKRLERYLMKKTQESEQDVEEILSNINPKDYSIMRIPYELIPKGFMDAAQVARSKATIHNGTYMSEYAAVFADDSAGFFKKSIIDSATVSPSNIIVHEDYDEIMFDAQLFGDPDKYYIFGVDPASEVDNFAIVVLEIHKNHRRVVYCWTTNKEQHRKEKREGYIQEDDYYAYCVLKIRELMARFPCKRIMLDSQGGGATIREGLRNERLIPSGQLKILPVIDENKEQDTDMIEGLHILELCNFSKYDWLSEANHGLRFDIERKIVLFPYFDPVALAIAATSDELNSSTYDNLEYCMTEIEELKKELVSIIVTKTSSGKDKWDTPETAAQGRKGYMRKDRYSALLMANMGARVEDNMISIRPFNTIGGFAKKSGNASGQLFYGNEILSKGLQEVYEIL